MLFRNLHWSHPRVVGQASMQQHCLHGPLRTQGCRGTARGQSPIWCNQWEELSWQNIPST